MARPQPRHPSRGRASDGAHPVRLGQRMLLTDVVVYSNAAMILTKDPAKQRVARTFLEWLLQPRRMVAS